MLPVVKSWVIFNEKTIIGKVITIQSRKEILIKKLIMEAFVPIFFISWTRKPMIEVVMLDKTAALLGVIFLFQDQKVKRTRKINSSSFLIFVFLFSLRCFPLVWLACQIMSSHCRCKHLCLNHFEESRRRGFLEI